ncbi:AaceriAEL156Wp [[Ashbya] aceris (nom. inval.)]|nr:AaceriAEL156Wp [[Ashbya] aceris (nom. inval.)]
MAFKVNAELRSCGGRLLKLSHVSNVCKSTMDVNVYLPVQYYNKSGRTIPTIYYLSGLTCTPQNASEKAFWQAQADKYGFAVVFPDTSPRGADVPNDPEGSWDFGQGAGFYVNATLEPFSKHYNMYDYIHNELPGLLAKHFGSGSEGAKIDFLENIGITGHSMGGFGALSGYLKNYRNPKWRFKSCSAFAPIVNPSAVPWGQKAFQGYLGQDKASWEEYDPCCLVKKVENAGDDTILIHVGTGDPFLEKHLKPELLAEAIKGTSWEGKVSINLVDGFDHSYYFVSTFVPAHAKYHAEKLGLV